MAEARQLEHFDSLVQMFLARAEEKGDAPFLWAKRDGQWHSISWSTATESLWSAKTGPNC